MHEMALTEGVLKVLEDQAGPQGYSKVKTVWLDIGDLSNVDPEAMRFCFDAVTRGSLAEGAALEIIRSPGQAWCMDCCDTVAISQRYDPCPRCGGHKLTVTGGDEMRIKELEVE